MRRAALAFIRVYQHAVSPWLPAACRFLPTCSQYAHDAIAGYGFWRGSWMALKRLSRCHPFHPGGWDPVPASSSKEALGP